MLQWGHGSVFAGAGSESSEFQEGAVGGLSPNPATSLVTQPCYRACLAYGTTTAPSRSPGHGGSHAGTLPPPLFSHGWGRRGRAAVRAIITQKLAWEV
jgi:hypothetical protein